MLTHEENELLCRVEGEAAMGQLMRRHWIPACLIEEVAEPDCTPKKVRLLGEDLVVFRDSDGRLGVLDERCPHRRASLALGRNEECGLRCLYHGWKIDVEGNVLEMASEPPESGLVQKVKMKAYPVREAGGFVWTYLGPAETMREFEAPAFAPTADTNVSIVKIHVDCNWAQVLEGQINSAHSSSLHSSDITPARVDSAKNAGTHWLRPSTDKAPRLQVERTSYGFHYAAIRRPIANSATHDYVRKTVYIAPFVCLIPPNNSYNVTSVIVPEDDTHTAFYFIAWRETGGIDQEAWRKFNGAQPGIDLTRDFRNLRTARQWLFAGPQRDEAWRLHRHPRDSQSGYLDVGNHGSDRGSYQGAPRRQRSGGRGVSAAHGRCGARDAEGRPGAWLHRAAHPACEHQFVRARPAQERRLADFRRGGGEASSEPAREQVA